MLCLSAAAAAGSIWWSRQPRPPFPSPLGSIALSS
ncbi:hypothetical protein ID866_2757 [Astraeus odoratus]|nr:hypothetical protein ID866_2757 [Astraeus odoratus]